MSVKVRAYQGNTAAWEADIAIMMPDGTRYRERRKTPASSATAARRWAEARQRQLLMDGVPKKNEKQNIADLCKEVPTIKTFAPRFLAQYAQANRQKPSGIAAKETILRVHLIPQFGETPLDQISNEDVQALKSKLADKAPKTVNNVLAVLSTLLRVALEWGEIANSQCRVRLLPTPNRTTAFHDFNDYERLVSAAKAFDERAYLVVLLGGEAGLRCGEMMALEWKDIDLTKGLLTVERSEWKGQVTAPKGGRLRHLPLTVRLSSALQGARHLRGRRVLCDKVGKPLTQKIVQVLVRETAKRAGLINGGVHVLRHTFCSHLAMKGAPVRAIQEAAGHQDLATTQRYMHLSPAALDAAIRLLDRREAVHEAGEMLEAAGNPA